MNLERARALASKYISVGRSALHPIVIDDDPKESSSRAIASSILGSARPIIDISADSSQDSSASEDSDASFFERHFPGVNQRSRELKRRRRIEKEKRQRERQKEEAAKEEGAKEDSPVTIAELVFPPKVKPIVPDPTIPEREFTVYPITNALHDQYVREMRGQSGRKRGQGILEFGEWAERQRGRRLDDVVYLIRKYFDCEENRLKVVEKADKQSMRVSYYYGPRERGRLRALDDECFELMVESKDNSPYALLVEHLRYPDQEGCIISGTEILRRLIKVTEELPGPTPPQPNKKNDLIIVADGSSVLLNDPDRNSPNPNRVDMARFAIFKDGLSYYNKNKFYGIGFIQNYQDNQVTRRAPLWATLESKTPMNEAESKEKVTRWGRKLELDRPEVYRTYSLSKPYDIDTWTMEDLATVFKTILKRGNDLYLTRGESDVLRTLLSYDLFEYNPFMLKYDKNLRY